jgi:hypothetical protein
MFQRGRKDFYFGSWGQKGFEVHYFGYSVLSDSICGKWVKTGEARLDLCQCSEPIPALSSALSLTKIVSRSFTAGSSFLYIVDSEKDDHYLIIYNFLRKV